MSNLNLDVSATGSQIGVSSKPFQNSSNYFTIYFLRSLSHFYGILCRYLIKDRRSHNVVTCCLVKLSLTSPPWCFEIRCEKSDSN